MAQKKLRKVGSTVRIKDKKWYNRLPKDEHGCVHGHVVTHGFTPEMAEHCGKKAKITAVINWAQAYNLDIDGEFALWTEQMLVQPLLPRK